MSYEEDLENIHRSMAQTEAPGCPYCGSKEKLVSDHIVPKSRGGSDGPENREQICEPCNAAKGAMTKEEFMAWIKGLVAFQVSKEGE